MKVLVTGVSRSGTNWVTEIALCSDVAPFTDPVEDRLFFSRPLPKDYGTKLCVDNKHFWLVSLGYQMELYPDLKVIFCLRHPYSTALANMYRSSPGQIDHDDLIQFAVWTPYTVHAMLIHAQQVHAYLHRNYGGRVHDVRLEDLIGDTEATVAGLASYLGVEPNEGMLTAYRQNRNPSQQQRGYTEGVDRDQADIWQRWQTAYDGYFAEKEEMVRWLFWQLRDICKEWGYETCGPTPSC